MPRRNKPNDVWKQLDLNPVAPCTCWLWKGFVNDKGLGYFTLMGKKVLVYRIVYWIMHPEWDINDKKSLILHSCTDTHGNAVDNPLCANPDHLRHGTREENAMDMMTRARSGLPKEVISDILKIMGNKDLAVTHQQCADVVAAKHSVDVSRQTVTAVMSGQRRKVLRDLLDAENNRVETSGDKDASRS